LKNGGWEVKGKGTTMKGVEWTKVKYTHSGHTLKHLFERQLKCNENQDRKIGTVYVCGGVLVEEGKVKEED
jgi:hypothetical protein